MYQFVNEVNGHKLPDGAKAIKISNGVDEVIYTFISRDNGESANIHQSVNGSIAKLKSQVRQVNDKYIFNQMYADVINYFRIKRTMKQDKNGITTFNLLGVGHNKFDLKQLGLI